MEWPIAMFSISMTGNLELCRWFCNGWINVVLQYTTMIHDITVNIMQYEYRPTKPCLIFLMSSCTGDTLCQKINLSFFSAKPHIWSHPPFIVQYPTRSNIGYDPFISDLTSSFYSKRVRSMIKAQFCLTRRGNPEHFSSLLSRKIPTASTGV